MVHAKRIFVTVISVWLLALHSCLEKKSVYIVDDVLLGDNIRANLFLFLFSYKVCLRVD